MNHQFLIRPAQLNHAFESNCTSGGDGQGSEITRRSFLKRTGGATMGTLVVLNSLTNTAKARAHPLSNCTAHGGGSCYWVGEINAVFDTHIPYGPTAPGYGESGRSGGIWTGKLSYTPKMCLSWQPLDPIVDIPVVIGGYILPPSDVVWGADSAIPTGTYWMNAAQILFPNRTTGPNVGFNLIPQPPIHPTKLDANGNRILRTGIYVHEKIREFGTSGCISFQDRHEQDGQATEQSFWSIFANSVKYGNDQKQSCPHNDIADHHGGQLQKIRVMVSYAEGVPTPNNLIRQANYP